MRKSSTWVQSISVSNRFSKLEIDEEENSLTLGDEVDEITDATCNEYKENGVKKMSSKFNHAKLNKCCGSKKKKKKTYIIEIDKNIKKTKALHTDHKDDKFGIAYNSEKSVDENKSMHSIEGRRNLELKKECTTSKVLASFSHINKFLIFQILTEKEIEALVKPNQFGKFSNLKKKCRRCNFRHYCHLNILGCSAMNKSCYSCNKPGHFPHSLNCKANRKEKHKKQIAQKSLKVNIKTKIGCKKCFKTHSPQQKSCCYVTLKYKTNLKTTHEAHSDVPVRQNYGPVRFLTDWSWSIKIL
jgi:hypothetical protein